MRETTAACGTPAPCRRNVQPRVTSGGTHMRFAGRRSLFVAMALAAGPARAATVVKVGAALSMTGPAAVYGATQKAGILAAVDEINKSGMLRGVKLEAIDRKSTRL